MHPSDLQLPSFNLLCSWWRHKCPAAEVCQHAKSLNHKIFEFDLRGWFDGQIASYDLTQSNLSHVRWFRALFLQNVVLKDLLRTGAFLVCWSMFCIFGHDFRHNIQRLHCSFKIDDAHSKDAGRPRQSTKEGHLWIFSGCRTSAAKYWPRFPTSSAKVWFWRSSWATSTTLLPWFSSVTWPANWQFESVRSHF